MRVMDVHEAFSSPEFNAPKVRTPSKLALVLPILLFIASFGVPAFILLTAIFGSEGQSKQLLAPGAVEFTMAEPGKLAILLETQTTYNGQSYFAAGVPAGTDIRVTEKATGEDIPVSLGGSYSESVGSTRRAGVGKCDIARPGDYVVSITGSVAPHVFLVRRSLLETLGVAIAASVAIALVGIVVSVKWLSVIARRFAAAKQVNLPPVTR
jgi:hypothetical protein